MTVFRYGYSSIANLAPGGVVVYTPMFAHPVGSSSTESNTTANVYETCTLQDGEVLVPTNIATGSFTFESRINSATGTISIVVTAGGTGSFEDTTHTDALANGDLINWRVTPGDSSATGDAIVLAHSIDGTDGQSMTGFTTAVSTTDLFFNVVGRTSGGGSTEDNIEVITHSPCNFTKSWTRILVNTVTGGNPTYTFRVNSASSAMVVTITASTTGEFEDTAHSIAVADGDTVNQYLQRVGSAGSINVHAATVISDVAANLEGTHQNVGSNASRFWPINGSVNGVDATETRTQLHARSTETVENAYVRVTANTLSGANGAVCLRVAAATSALSASITAGVTGVFEDTTNTVTTADGDLVNWGVLENGASGAFTPQTLKWEWPAAAAAPTSPPDGKAVFSTVPRPKRALVVDELISPLTLGIPNEVEGLPTGRVTFDFIPRGKRGRKDQVEQAPLVMGIFQTPPEGKVYYDTTYRGKRGRTDQVSQPPAALGVFHKPPDGRTWLQRNPLPKRGAWVDELKPPQTLGIPDEPIVTPDGKVHTATVLPPKRGRTDQVTQPPLVMGVFHTPPDGRVQYSETTFRGKRGRADFVLPPPLTLGIPDEPPSIPPGLRYYETTRRGKRGRPDLQWATPRALEAESRVMSPFKPDVQLPRRKPRKIFDSLVRWYFLEESAAPTPTRPKLGLGRGTGRAAQRGRGSASGDNLPRGRATGRH